jgi:hypothetical protein
VHECPLDATPAFGLSCCYAHLKDRLASGADLSAEELAFVGHYPSRRSVGGWHVVGGYAPEPDELSAEDRAMLQGLMSLGPLGELQAERFTFLS